MRYRVLLTLPLLFFVQPAQAENYEEALALLKELKAEQAALGSKIAALEGQILAGRQEPAEALAVAAEDEPENDFIVYKGENTSLALGGALRLNAAWRSEDDADQDTFGNAGFDLFRLDVSASYDDWELDVQYRWYEYMDTIHHGYLAYNFSPQQRLEFGVTQVPFGLLPYASHSFWFSQGYYLGLEDDYDAGVKYRHEAAPWVFDIGFFKNEERNNSASPDRYSFDVTRSGVQQNEEENQFNLRVARQFDLGADHALEAGVSGAWGQLYNRTTEDSGDYWRAAAHLDFDSGPWELQLQGSYYDYSPENPAGVDDNTVLMGAFADTELVAAEGALFGVNVARRMNVDTVRAIDGMICYNDYSYLKKRGRGDLPDSQMNVTGCSFGIGPIYTYVDFIAGKNAPFLGAADALGPSSDSDWQARFNINIGWYF